MEERTRKLHTIFDENGTITIYLVVVFVTLIVFVGLLVDLARISIAQNQLRRAANASARSVLADYETTIKQEFGLFSYAKEKETCDKDFGKYLKLNLASTAKQGFNLMDYRLENSRAEVLSPLIQQEVLKKQILEDMKYKAPTELALFVADKIGSISKIFRFFQGKNTERKQLGAIKEKQSKIEQISKDIEEKKHILLDKKAVLEQKEQEAINQSDPKKKRDIQLEVDDLEKEIALLKAELRGSLATCKELNQQIETERGDLIEKGYTGATDPDVVDNRLRKTEQSMNERLQAANRNIEESCSELSRDIEKSLKALDRNSYTEIGFSAANLYGNKGTDDGQQTNKSNLIEQEKQVRELVAGTVYRDCLQVVNKRFINENPEEFEKETGKDIEEIINKIQKIISIEEIVLDARDELYINEYVLHHFSCLTEASAKKNALYTFYNSEAEYICYGGDSPCLQAVSDIYFIRWGLDTMAYLCFSKAPIDPLSRFIYATVMGAIQATIDTLKLVMGQEVAIAEMIDPANPAGGNPLADIRTNYKEHLRMLLFLHEDSNQADGDDKLIRILQIIKARNGRDPASLNTVVRGRTEISIKLWFLPLAGFEDLERGPFGTKIKNGRCHIIKQVEFGY